MRLLSLLKKRRNKKGRTAKDAAIGIIIDNKDPEGLSRVRLNFPWLGKESDWVKVASLKDGQDCGSYSMPEVGNEVLVEFKRGDFRYPIVLGSLWNGNEKPLETKSDEAENHKNKLRS